MKRILTVLALIVFLAFPVFATVSDTESPVKIYTSGTATEYPIPFDYISDSDIVVTLVNATTGVETAQTLDVDYTIVDETVTYSVAPGAAYKVVIRRETPYTQEASFSAGEAPPLSTYESAFDKATFLAQDLDERLQRALLLPETTATKNVIWPDLALNAGKLVRINTDGDGLEAIATIAAGSALDVTAYCDAADLTELHAYQSTSGLTVSDVTLLHEIATTSGLTVSDVTLLHEIATTSGLTAAEMASLNSIVTTAGVTLGKLPLGYVERSKFAYVDADTITIGPGVYDHQGTANQLVYWNSTLTFDSTDSGTQWYYLYIDDSAVVTHASPLLTATEFCISTTAPTYSATKHGWYNGNDRCIFAYHVTSGTIDAFYHDGGDYVRMAASEDRLSADLASRSSVTLTIPAFSTKAKCLLYALTNAGYYLMVAPADEDGAYTMACNSTSFESIISDFITSSDQKIWIALSDYTGTNYVAEVTHGWFFPTGM